MQNKPYIDPLTRAMLLNVLWHHQGGSSQVGQPIRAMLGIGEHARMADWQVRVAQEIEAMVRPQPGAEPPDWQKHAITLATPTPQEAFAKAMAWFDSLGDEFGGKFSPGGCSMSNTPDPKLVAVKATIAYKSDDGYRSEETLGSMREGADDPISVLANTVQEASRLLALFGHSERATGAVSHALGAVAAWRKTQEQEK